MRPGRWPRRGGPVTWAPCNPWVRAAIAAADPDAPLEPDDWLPIARDIRYLERPFVPDAPVTVGVVGGAGDGQWPDMQLQQALPPDANVVILGNPPKSLIPKKLPKGWRIFGEGEIAIDWFLREIDVLVCALRAGSTAIPDALIATAMANGLPVVLPARLRSHCGEGPVYFHGLPRDAVGALVESAEARAAAGARGREFALGRFSAERYLDRIRALLGKRRRRTTAAKPGESKASPATAIFLASNGIGMGHVARLLAIARRTAENIAPVFITMAPVAGVLEQFGYRADYLPSLMYTGADPIA